MSGGPEPLTYAQAGVSLHAADAIVDRVRSAVASTRTPRVLGDLGGFAGLVSAGGYRDPVLVAGTDGVGTKLMLQREAGRLRDSGVDCVAMCVNDVLMHAAPSRVLFLDYIAVGRLDPERVADARRGRRRRLPPGRLRAARRRDRRAPRHVRRRRPRPRGLRARRRRARRHRRRRARGRRRRGGRAGRERRALQRLLARAPPARARRRRRRTTRPATCSRPRASTRAPPRRCAAPATCARWRTSRAAASRATSRACCRRASARASTSGAGRRRRSSTWLAGPGRGARRDAPRLQRRARLRRRSSRPARPRRRSRPARAPGCEAWVVGEVAAGEGVDYAERA